MTEPTKKPEETEQSSIDYSSSQAEIDKAKQKASDQDNERLAEESK